jgi:hypothetical protein
MLMDGAPDKDVFVPLLTLEPQHCESKLSGCEQRFIAAAVHINPRQSEGGDASPRRAAM